MAEPKEPEKTEEKSPPNNTNNGENEEIEKAASELYLSLKPEDCESFTKGQYFEVVKALPATRVEKKFLKSTGRKILNDEEVTQEDFVATVSRRLHSGQIDPLQDLDEMEAYNNASVARKLVKYPGATLTMAFDAGVEFVTGSGVELALSAIPVDQINVLVAFFLLSILSIKWLLTVVCTMLFYVCFAIMLVCSLQMFKNKRKQREVKAMSTMLKQYNDKLRPDKIEDDFSINSMRPYWTFFGTLVVFVPSYYLMNKAWVPCSELAFVSWALGLAYLFYLSDFTEPVVVPSLVLNIISTLPHFVPKSVSFKVLKFLTFSFYSLKLRKHFYLNLSLPSFCNILLLFLFFGMVLRKSWAGICQTFVPHMIGFFWWQIGVIFYDYSTWLGLARASLGWASFALLMPVISIVGFFYGFITFVLSVKFFTMLKVLITAFIILLPVGLSIWQSYEFSVGGFYISGASLRSKKTIGIFLGITLVGGLIAGGLAFTASDEDESEAESQLPWRLYNTYCGSHNNDVKNKAQRQIDCYVFRDMAVNWTGTVEEVNITLVENSAQDFLTSLPTGIAEHIRCIYGDPLEKCDDENLDEVQLEVCKMRNAYGKLCHMRHASTYTFMVTINIQDDDMPGTFYVQASHDFHKVILRLRQGHEVNIQGHLIDLLGSDSPMVYMDDVKCLNCMMEIEPMEAHVKTETISDKLLKTALQTISFFTSPLLEYEEQFHNKMLNETATTQ